MHPVDSPDEAAFRAEARRWLEQNASRRSRPPVAPSAIVAEWKPEEEEARLAEARRWQATKFDAGWAGIAWPTEYGGRGGTIYQQHVFDEEEAAFDVPRDALVVGLGWCGPAILHLGTPEQRRRFLPPMLRGDEVWCQLFSEPGAGSDLASLATKAHRDGADWVLEGEKTWSTFAHHADWGLCIARHGPDRHRGLTAFLVDMSSPGVVVTPIRQMTGAANFNQVYLDGVRVPDRLRLGEVGDGWRVVITTFMYERVAAYLPVRQVVDAARPLVSTSHPSRRARWTRAFITARVLELLRLRQITALDDGVPGPHGSLIKLAGTLLLDQVYDLGLDALGPVGMVATGGAGEWVDAFLGTPGLRIGGGTDQIQRNIIAERILGLPRDPR